MYGICGIRVEAYEPNELEFKDGELIRKGAARSAERDIAKREQWEAVLVELTYELRKDNERFDPDGLRNR